MCIYKVELTDKSLSVVASFTVQNERIKITNCEKTDKKNTDSKNKTKVSRYRWSKEPIK